MFDFLQKSESADIVYDAVNAIKYDQREIERTFARLFSTDDGRKVLSHLQVMGFHRVHGPTTSDEQLRYAEGGRALVANILRLIDKGRSA